MDSLTSNQTLEYEEVEREYAYQPDTDNPSAPIYIKEKIRRLRQAENISSVKKKIEQKQETKTKITHLEKQAGTVNFILFAVVVVVVGIVLHFRLKK